MAESGQSQHFTGPAAIAEDFSGKDFRMADDFLSAPWTILHGAIGIPRPPDWSRDTLLGPNSSWNTGSNTVPQGPGVLDRLAGTTLGSPARASMPASIPLRQYAQASPAPFGYQAAKDNSPSNGAPGSEVPPPPLSHQVGAATLGVGVGQNLGRQAGNAYLRQAAINWLKSEGLTASEIADALASGEGAVEGSPLGPLGALGGAVLGGLGLWGLDWMFDKPKGDSAKSGQ